MLRIWSIEAPKYLKEAVLLKGWVNTRRNMGKIVFIDLRDRSGLVQIVFAPQDLDEKSQEAVKKIRPEFVIEVEGQVRNRPENQINKDLPTGEVEVAAKRVIILSEAKTPLFPIDNEIVPVSEEKRLKYRYLDLRHERMKKNLILRYQVIKFLRDYLDKEGFLEIETPILTKGTPEGAREFLVPSRIYPGKFYVLPQSPQQFKQLLMVAGFERYFQVARCFRDEDTRGDRQPEFTQLDIEMSFIEEKDILELIERMMIELVEKIFPEKKISQKPFPRFFYQEVIEKYKTDKPDLRKDKNNPNELAFCWITDQPLFEYSKIEKKIISVHHLFTAPKDEELGLLEKEPLKVKAKSYDLVLNGYEIGGGSIRVHQRELQNKIFKILGLEEKEIQRRFGHMLEAFEYGAPPHGGIALGLDRLIMIFANEPNIREVIAFPKTADAKDLMMGAPSELPEAQIKEAHIKIIK
ncbi:MAG: aspartate--tRNA ligase [Patescibacteria group bacterium]